VRRFFISINRTEISADSQTSFFWAQCERSLWLNDSCVGDVGRAWVTWARRGLGRGELFRGFFVFQLSSNPIRQAREALAGSKTLRHATVRGSLNAVTVGCRQQSASSAEAGDLPRGSQEEGRRHGGRRPIKVYALHSCQRRIGLEFGGARVHR
jgi:hypothetical protein